MTDPASDGHRRPHPRPRGRTFSKDPWARAPVEELQDQVLPRWFVLLGIAAVLAAVGVFVVAFTAFRPDAVPVAERRPPPAAGLTPADGLAHDVGEYVLGDAEPVLYDGACALLEGVRIAGTQADRDSLRRGLAAVCNVASGTVAEALRAFADAGGVVRFATFSETGIPSAASVDDSPPQILVNARYARTNPLLIAPPVAHDVIARTDPGDAETELAARMAEVEVCKRLFEELPQGCADARELVELPDPVGALRAAGYE